MSPRCRNCGDKTNFTERGDRQADYQRVTLGWCQRCLNAAKKAHKRPEDWDRHYQDLLEEMRLKTPLEDG